MKFKILTIFMLVFIGLSQAAQAMCCTTCGLTPPDESGIGCCMDPGTTCSFGEMKRCTALMYNLCVARTSCGGVPVCVEGTPGCNHGDPCGSGGTMQCGVTTGLPTLDPDPFLPTYCGCTGCGSASCVNPLGGANIAHGASITTYQAATVACGSSCNSEVRTCNNGVLSGSYSQATCDVNPPCAGCTEATYMIPLTPVNILPFTHSSPPLPTWDPACTPVPPGLPTQIHIASIPWQLPTGITISGDPTAAYLTTIPSGALIYTYQTLTPPPPPVSCANPLGGANIPHGGNVTAYQTATVPCGNVCSSEVRTCNNGVLSGSYTNAGCSVDICPPPSCIPDGDVCKLAGMCGGGPEAVDDCVSGCCSMGMTYNVAVPGCFSDEKRCGSGVCPLPASQLCLGGTTVTRNAFPDCSMPACPPPPVGCGGLNCDHPADAGCSIGMPCGSGGTWMCNAPNGFGEYSCTCTGCTPPPPSTWLICLETIHYEDNCSPGSTYTYNQVLPADCSGHSDNTVDNGLCDAVNHSFDHFSYSSVMCTANGAACTSGAGCCSNSCQFISGSWQCAP